MSSTERFDAASISITSSDVPAAIVRQDSHSPQGVTVGPLMQFRERARIFATDVVLLADHLVEGLRAVATIEGGLAHERASLATAQAAPDGVRARCVERSHL